MMLATVALAISDGRIRIGVTRWSWRIIFARSLCALAALSALSAALPYYAEARFSVLTSDSDAGLNNPFVRMWTNAGEAKNVLHFGLWVYVSFALAIAAAAFSAAELLDRSQPAAAPIGTRFRRIRWLLSQRKAAFVLALVLSYSGAISVGKTLDRGSKESWGVGWQVDDHRGRTFVIDMSMWAVFYAAFGGLLPMTLIGLPLSRTSALWRAMGRSYEEAISFHRALGHVMMAMFTLHGVGYMTIWLARGWDFFLDEMSDWLHCGRCTHINNLAGFIAWLGGFLLWITSLKWVRRRNYALFFNTHQLHLIFFAFGCIHWPTLLAYAAPSIVFYAADAALRRHVSRGRVEALARGRPAKAPSITTLVIARTADAATAPREAACPHAQVPVARGVEARCPAMSLPGQETDRSYTAHGEEWTGGCVYLAVPSLGRFPYLQWHPFSIGGSADGGASLVVHVNKCRRWTNGLARLVAASASAGTRVAGAADDADAGADQRLRLHMIGPIPAPPSLLDCVSEARRGTPLVLIGGGAGIVPIVAILRRLACGQPPAACVRLTLIVREACALEQLLDGRMLPLPATDGAAAHDAAIGAGAVNDEAGGYSATGYQWLCCRIFLTSKHLPRESSDEDGTWATPPEECTRRVPDGPFRIAVDSGGLLHATAAPFAPLTSHPEPTGVPLQVYEATSLVGAVVGYMSIAWPLVWRGDNAPWARRNASTLTTGGGGFVLATVCSLLAAALLLKLSDLPGWLRSLTSHPERSPPSVSVRAKPAARTSSTGVELLGVQLIDDGMAAVAEDGAVKARIEAAITPNITPSSNRPDQQSYVPVPVAGRTRPDMGELLRREPPEARVAAGGPPAMFDALNKALSAAGRPPSVRLTHSM